MPTVFIPADVPATMEKEFTDNYNAITKGTEKLFLFAGDQKIEHLNDNFYGNGLSPAINFPEHLFQIAATGDTGVFATQLGLIARYGKKFPNVNYLAKLNSKSYLTPPPPKDPLSRSLWSVEQVVKLKQESGLHIRGIGYTIYLGSEYEGAMLREAAQAIYTAHQYGMIAVIWMYPRGITVKNDQDPNLIAGAAGVANAIGADFVKIKVPKAQNVGKALQIAVQAAGNTKVICSGGKRIEPKKFLKGIQDQLSLGHTDGIAVGRNLYQYSLAEAKILAQAIAKIIYGSKAE
ncbi:aldolase [candidate division TM6 bacterium RIFCSPHIGHO2_12_FULL_36_22]|nr:MAG: aldolase [candidate division TM6 bacterium RIFCSPHIGHO2_12_FULL_36_22]